MSSSNSNYQKAQEAIKAKNGGELPSDLYLMTNAQLGQILYDMTGDIKHKMRSATKEALVKRIQKLVLKSSPPAAVSVVGAKRKATDETADTTAPPAKIQAVKVPRNCLSTLSQIQIVQMKRVMSLNHDQIMSMQHDKDLRPLWDSIGMTAKYPAMTGKEKVMERLKTFAQNNLVFHGHLVL